LNTNSFNILRVFNILSTRLESFSFPWSTGLFSAKGILGQVLTTGFLTPPSIYIKTLRIHFDLILSDGIIQ